MSNSGDKFPRLEFPFKDLLYSNNNATEFWKKYDSYDYISSPKNRKILEESSDLLKSFFSDLSDDDEYSSEIDKVDWLVFSLWDHYKKSRPKFAICLITHKKNGNLNFLNPFVDLDYDNMWENDNIKQEYGDYYEKLNDFEDVELWDFIHTYKKFSWPLVIVEEESDCNEIDELFKLIKKGDQIYPKFEDVIDGDYWYWDKFEERYELDDEFEDFEDQFNELIIRYYESMAKNKDETEYIYELPILMDVADSESDMWFRSSATISLGTSEPIDIGFWEWIAYGHIKSFYPTFLIRSFFDRAKRQSLRSAIAAIMGRNMSHNIGSHVLWHLTAQLEK